MYEIKHLNVLIAIPLDLTKVESIEDKETIKRVI